MTTNLQIQAFEQLINEVDDLLRCASATAYESADALKGSQRDHAFSVFHLIKVARGKVDQLSQQQASLSGY